MIRRRKQGGSPRVAVAYLRVSTTDQRVEQQRDAIERWAAASGITIAAWCVDMGVSGAAPIDERPGLLEALAALRERKAGLLVAAKRDRLARDVATAAAIERLTVEAGARVVTSDGLDSSDTPEGALIRAIIDAMSQYERALIRARTKAALRAKAARGELCGEAPFGFRARDGLLEWHPGEQAALESMKEHRRSGATQLEIVERLTAEGHKPRGTRWHATTIGRLVRDI